jgi:hypothetical protein
MIDWYKEILAKGSGLPRVDLALGGYRYGYEESGRWVATASSALQSVFPSGHAVFSRWEAALQEAAPRSCGVANSSLFDTLRGIFQSSLDILEHRGLATLQDTVRAETVSEVLDQADVLLDGGYLVAATVMAGGALETHLRHLCERHSVLPAGHGAINKYNDAINGARKAGNEVYPLTDAKQVTAWGDMRNKAAHKPAEYDRSKQEVRLMVDGILAFMARCP